MEIMGVDLHKRESQLSIKADDGAITDRRIETSRERFTSVLGGRMAGESWVAVKPRIEKQDLIGNVDAPACMSEPDYTHCENLGCRCGRRDC